ncbi:MAG: hypothetical protein DMF88_03105 [Acidobacteria bacterium]|nr:MAG: hypothetical protein DMF88_03105 [Acidobacteriota bacterium]
MTWNRSDRSTAVRPSTIDHRVLQDTSGFFDDTFAVLCGDMLIDVDLARRTSMFAGRSASDRASKSKTA